MLDNDTHAKTRVAEFEDLLVCLASSALTNLIKIAHRNLHINNFEFQLWNINHATMKDKN